MNFTDTHPQSNIISADASSISKTNEVWLYLSIGRMSGGMFITPEQARELANELNEAADASESLAIEREQAEYVAADHAYDAAREDRIFGRR